MVTHTELSGESAVSLQNDQETAQLCYVPAHEESMYIDVFSHSKRTSAFEFWDKVKLQSFLYRKQANKHCGLLVHQQKSACGGATYRICLLKLKVSEWNLSGG